MAVDPSVTPEQWLAKQIETDDPDLLRSMVKTMAEALMSAEADSLCGAAYGERSVRARHPDEAAQQPYAVAVHGDQVWPTVYDRSGRGR
jgi:hypothetical protein